MTRYLIASFIIVPVVPWEAPAARGGGCTQNNYQFFTTLFWRLNAEKTSTKHKFRVGLHVTFGLNDRILIKYPSWSAKGFAEAMELLIARWVKLLDSGIWLFVFDTLWKLAYVINITKANAISINILSITAGCMEYRLFVAHSYSQESVTTSSQLERGGISAVDSQENHLKCCHQMSALGLNAKMQQNGFRFGLYSASPDP